LRRPGILEEFLDGVSPSFDSRDGLAEKKIGPILLRDDGLRKKILEERPQPGGGFEPEQSCVVQGSQDKGNEDDLFFLQEAGLARYEEETNENRGLKKKKKNVSLWLEKESERDSQDDKN